MILYWIDWYAFKPVIVLWASCKVHLKKKRYGNESQVKKEAETVAYKKYSENIVITDYEH